MITICAKYKHKADELELALKQQGYEFKRLKGLTRFFRVETQKDDAFIKNLAILGEIIDPDGEPGKAAFEVSDHAGMLANDVNQLGPHSWGIDRVIRRNAPYSVDRPPRTWDSRFFTQRTGRGVDMYILESAGYETSLPEFQSREGTCRLLYEDSTNDMAYLGYYHANGVASCAGGATMGVARGADMWLVTTYNFNSGNPAEVPPDAFVAAVDSILTHYNSRAHLNKPACINFSTIGGALSFQAFVDCIEAGIVWVSAAGNGNQNTSSQTLVQVEAHPNIIGVGGIQANDTPYKREGFSTAYGEHVSIYAPAQYIMMQLLTSDGGMGVRSGTSFASPITCGVVACMLEGYGRLQNAEQVGLVKQRLIDNSTKNAIRVAPISPVYASFQAGESFNRITYLDPFISFENIEGLPAL